MQKFTSYRLPLVITMLLLLMLFLQACGTDPAASVPTTGSLPKITPQVTQHTSSSSQNDVQKWVSLVDSYVHISNYIATIDPQLYQHFDAQITSFVQQAVKHYNGLSLSLRKFGVTMSASASSSSSYNYANVSFSYDYASSNATSAPCKQSYSVTSHWWGVAILMNHCLASDTGNKLAVSSGVAGALSLFGLDLPLDAVSGILAIYSGSIALADSHCGDTGANLDISWVGIAWVTAIC